MFLACEGILVTSYFRGPSLAFSRSVVALLNSTKRSKKRLFCCCLFPCGLISWYFVRFAPALRTVAFFGFSVDYVARRLFSRSIVPRILNIFFCRGVLQF